MKIEREQWGKGIYQRKNVEIITIIDENTNFLVQFTNIGASINKVHIPNKQGKIIDIHYGRNSPEEIFEIKGNQGAIIGRVASNIYFSKFEIGDGEHKKTYTTSRNLAGTHTQHGGFNGFDQKIWECTSIENNERENSVYIKFEYTSLDGEEGFPGTAKIEVIYTVALNAQNPKMLIYNINWKFNASSDKTTLFSLTNHGYWNLDGIGQPIDNLKLQIYSPKFFLKHNMFKLISKTILYKMGIGKKNPKFQLPYTEVTPIESIGIDFNKSQSLKSILKDYGPIDTNFILNNDFNINDSVKSSLRKVASLKSDKNKIQLDVESSDPSFVVFTSLGKQLNGDKAICIEPMKPTNSINTPELRNWVIYKPNETYQKITKFSFSYF